MESQTLWTVHRTRPSTRLLREGQGNEDLKDNEFDTDSEKGESDANGK